MDCLCFKPTNEPYHVLLSSHKALFIDKDDAFFIDVRMRSFNLIHLSHFELEMLIGYIDVIVTLMHYAEKKEEEEETESFYSYLPQLHELSKEVQSKVELAVPLMTRRIKGRGFIFYLTGNKTFQISKAKGEIVFHVYDGVKYFVFSDTELEKLFKLQREILPYCGNVHGTGLTH